MKKIAIGFNLLLASVLVVSCGNTQNSKYPGFEKIENGLHVKYFEKNAEGRPAKIGEVISMSMMYSLNDDSVIFDSREMGQPVQMRLDSGKYEGDLSNALARLNVGDSVAIIVNGMDFFKKTAMVRELPPFIDSTSTLHFYVKLNKVETMEELQAAQDAELEAYRSSEVEQRTQYLTDNNITTEPTASGLIFILKEKGSGKNAETGKIVRVNYTGKLLDGTYFDTSIESVAKEEGLFTEGRTYEPIEFTLGQGQVIKGWDEGLAMMNVGDKAQFIIPSELAYGENVRPGGPIPPFATLVFDVELVEVFE